jgi:DNA-directed RNA polymerase specialized sigma24 family protein
VSSAIDDRERANTHRPDCPHCLRRAAIEMQRQGLLPRDIADALGLPADAVRQLIEDLER